MSIRLGLGLGFCRAFAATAAWSPSQLSGLYLWLRADLGITQSGGNITGWADQSGNGNNAANATADYPTTATGINGKATVHFDGAAAFIIPSNAASGAKSIALIFKSSTNPGAGNFQSLITLATSTPVYSEILLSDLGGAYLPYTFGDDFNSITSVGSATALDTSAHGLIQTYNGGTNTATGSYTALLDNSAMLLAASSTDARASALASIGGRVSTAPAVSAGLIGDIAEVVITTDVFSAGDLANLHTYFNSLYGAGVG